MMILTDDSAHGPARNEHEGLLRRNVTGHRLPDEPLRHADSRGLPSDDANSLIHVPGFSILEADAGATHLLQLLDVRSSPAWNQNCHDTYTNNILFTNQTIHIHST